MASRHKILLAVSLLAISLQLSAQTQSINGSVRGRVTDPSGAPVPGASISVENGATAFTRNTASNLDGYFVIPNLPIGTYTVTIKQEGFEQQRRPGVILDAGIEAVIDAALSVGSVSTTVEVTGGAPVIEPSRVDTGRTIGTLEVDNLPLTSRNPYNFLLFQPGVSGHPNPELGVPRVVNTNGLDNRVQYQLDGMPDTESDQYGLRLFAISESYVREVQTVSNSFAPEFGRMLMFRVCDHSWHGFLPQKGQRMSLQLCYVDSEAYVRKEYLRHSVSAYAKSVPLLRKIIDWAPRRLPGAR